MNINLKLDDRQVKTLGPDLRLGIVVGLLRVAERGEQILRDEVPKVTHNLEQGVSSDVDQANLQAKLLIAARTGRTGREGALLHLPGGQTREITLRGRPAFDYAEAVATGTGIYGPRGAVIRPKSAKALLIPVDAAPLQGAFITSGGQTFIVRRFSRGRKPNPYDVRTAQRLEKEAPAIFDRGLADFAQEGR